MICPNCGVPLQDGTQRCIYCGTIPTPAAEKQTTLSASAQEAAISPTPRKKSKTVVVCILLFVVILILAAAAGTYSRLESKRNTEAYDDAMTLLESGNVDKALSAFRQLGDYKDAPDMVENLKDYQKALRLLDKHKYDDARKLFRELGDFHDCPEYVDSGVEYHKACFLMDCAEEEDEYGLNWTAYDADDYYDPLQVSYILYLSAAEIFEDLGDYRNASALMKECTTAAEKLDKSLRAKHLQTEIIGTWTVGITFTEEMLDIDGARIDGVPINLIFDEDGKVTLVYGDEAAEIIEEQLLDIMVDMVYDEMEAEGTSRDETDALFEDYYGMSLADYMQDYLDEFDIMDQLRDLEETHDYEVDGDTLIIDGTEMTAEITDNKLTISDCEDEDFWSALDLDLPIVMKRVR